MSDSQCKPGDTTGFPVTLAQSLYSNWPSTANAQGQLQNLVVPTDFSIQWQNNGFQTCNISVRQTLNSATGPGVFQISGFITDGYTISYGPAIYQCSGVISIVQNQHPTFTQGGGAQYEMILAFQIKNKNINPSSPDIILLCRPLAFQNSGTNTPFWNAVNAATTYSRLQNNIAVDMSSFFGYNPSTPMPMVTYQTCLPVKLFNNSQFSYGSLKIRVNVIPQPLHIVATETGLGKCSSINKYTLITNNNGPIDIFGRGNILQFRDGLDSDSGYPSDISKTNLVPSSAPRAISAFADILNKFQILVPEAFLGKSLADISNSQTAPPPVKPNKKAYKCYTIDPEKDIVGDQIMVDPTNGQSLKNTMKDTTDMSDFPRRPDTKYYTLYGDDIKGIVTVKYTFPVTGGSGIPGLTVFIGQDGSLVRYAIAPIGDLSQIIESGNFPATISGITSYDDMIKLMQQTKPIDDIKRDTGLIHINEVTISGTANSATSGILPGDIEHILTIIAISLGTLTLLAYLGFIVHMVLYRDNGFHNSLPHVLGFIACFIGLVVFSVFSEKTDD
jgi:hypothetical protein